MDKRLYIVMECTIRFVSIKFSQPFVFWFDDSFSDWLCPVSRKTSTAGAALNFFAYFLVSRQESMWGPGQRPGYKKSFNAK